MVSKTALVFGLIGGAFGFSFVGDVKSIIFGFFAGFIFGLLMKRAI